MLNWIVLFPLLRQAKIILADEITAALDAENSQALRNILLSLPQTVIEIAHHYSNKQDYDFIWQLKEQKISQSQQTDQFAGDY
ncbi:hypothetical protein [Enterococcus timonensis]|uniref:hypothetical protein n=1 Tax=Enterococcus timonensis TaxID=1852364 RepID=UPI0008D96F5A|nr:hypothetical protein [Enterococcus timonensis]